MGRNGLATLALLVTLLGTGAGCGGDEEKPTEVVELEETLGFSPEGILERQSRVENQIRDCMKEQGFDYTPIDPFAQQQALYGKARLSEEEFIRQFGYGISTLLGRGSDQSNPNERIRSNLSPSDQRAYDRALGGDNPGATFAEAVDSGHFDQLGGCTAEASEAVFGGSAVLDQLVNKLDELDGSILEDQRMVDAEAEWSKCMGDRGYRYGDPGEIEGSIEERFQAIVGSGVAPGATSPPPPDADRAALSQLRSDEVKVATADFECEESEITPVELVVRPQYEKQFENENRRLLARVEPLPQ
jgi:hypothetical protein